MRDTRQIDPLTSIFVVLYDRLFANNQREIFLRRGGNIFKPKRNYNYRRMSQQRSTNLQITR